LSCIGCDKGGPGGMISMDRVDSIRRKYRRGEPVAAIAREVGVSRDTVYKYARMEDLSPEPPKARRRRPSKMDRWAPLVDQWLTDDFRENRKQRHTAHRVWRRLVDECGADVSEQTVRRYVREARLRLGGGPGCFLDLDWPAGVAQVDFGHAAFVVRGTRREMPYFVASFPYSNVGLAQVFPGENAECVCQGLRNVFEFVGGVPTRVVFDNATGVGRRVCDRVRTTRLFEACSAHYGFEYRFCSPYSGHEKGSVENKVGTQRRNLFVPVPRVWDVDGYNERLLERSRDMSRKEHYRKGRPELELFEDDLAAMLALPARPFECVEYRRARADKKGKVRVDGRHWYSTSPECAGREMVVGLWATRVAVMDGDGAVVAEHARAYGDAPTDTTDPASQLPLLANRLGAWRESRVRAALPDDLREHIDALDRRGLGEAVRCMRDQCALSGWDATVRATSVSLRASGRIDPSAVALAVSRAETGEVSYDEAVDLAEYDRLTGVVADG
jgi:transposase